MAAAKRIIVGIACDIIDDNTGAELVYRELPQEDAAA